MRLHRWVADFVDAVISTCLRLSDGASLLDGCEIYHAPVVDPESSRRALVLRPGDDCAPVQAMAVREIVLGPSHGQAALTSSSEGTIGRGDEGDRLSQVLFTRRTSTRGENKADLDFVVCSCSVGRCLDCDLSGPCFLRVD